MPVVEARPPIGKADYHAPTIRYVVLVSRYQFCPEHQCANRLRDALAEQLRFLRALFIYSGELVTGCALRRSSSSSLAGSLRIPVLGPLNEENHYPGAERRHAMPRHEVMTEGPPGQGVSHNYEKCRRTRRGRPHFGQPLSEIAKQRSAQS